jgi:hypothetical protein
MDHLALYDVLYIYKDTHKIVLDLAESLTDEQIHWKPAGYNLSIGFHLWHLARESDFLKARFVEIIPGLGAELDDGREIWSREELAAKWNFPAGLDLGQAGAGTGLRKQAAGSLPIPEKEELLDYLRRSYEAVEKFVELLDTCHPNFENADEDLKKKIQNIRLNILVFLLHDGRHLGMAECLKGLLTGKGTATA